MLSIVHHVYLRYPTQKHFPDGMNFIECLVDYISGGWKNFNMPPDVNLQSDFKRLALSLLSEAVR